MAFSACHISHTYLGADLTPAVGSLEWTLEAAMTNDGVTLVPGTSLNVTLDPNGAVSFSLTSTEDPDTKTQGTPLWRCDERIVGAPPRTWTCEVPSGGVSIDLAELLPDDFN